MHSAQRFHIGVLAESLRVSCYLHNFIQWALRQPNIRLTVVILRPSGSGQNAGATSQGTTELLQCSPTPGPSHAVDRWLCTQLDGLERRLLRRRPHLLGHLERYDLAGTEVQTVCLAGTGARLAAPSPTPGDLERLASLGLDLLLELGGASAPRGCLSVARLGVVRLLYSDDSVQRGGPSGFWEVYRRHDSTGFTFLHLAEAHAEGRVLLRGSVPTQLHYLSNQAELLRWAYRQLALLMQRTAQSGSLPLGEPRMPYCHRTDTFPTWLEALWYVARLQGLRGRKTLDRLLGRVKRRSVAVLRSHWRGAVLSDAVTIPNPPGRFLADPFVVERGGRTCCFVEDFDYRRGRGSIAAYEIGPGAITPMGLVVQEPFHLSFPFVFEYEGELYMCPETGEARDIRLYRCVDFPGKWVYEKTLMREVSAADTMLFARDGRWWMFTNVDPLSDGTHSAELCVFWAAHPLSDVWTPHPLNPIICDATRARNAGLLFDGQRLFRVSQRWDFDFYGKQAQINEVLTLDEQRYEEQTAGLLQASFGRSAVGMHHMHGVDSITVFDYVTHSSRRG